MYPDHITLRRKGQRYDQDLLPLFLSQQGEVQWDIELAEVLRGTYVVQRVGEFNGFSHSGHPCVYRAYVVTRPDGLQVPAYSHNTDSHVVCQDYRLKAGRPS